ncbi:hypothetical protein [Paenibacillus sp. NFR01]|uniref:hypothetical protein n=1 Tax=Paenibacillus sp. NFR01 TaxID=1566279 RepID=UPI0008B32E60|nr:hypothetical protein [Paenibacillus sp. NFR01]SEU19664.1 hypothetical protein SAMN03159358_3903 [Paenibacillus sp. NFR01]
MKRRLIAGVLFALVVFTVIQLYKPACSIGYEQVKVEDLQEEVQDQIAQIKEPNIYLITNDDAVILYSTLGKSGMYTYPQAEIQTKGKKLIVDITSKSNPGPEDTKENLIAKLHLDRLPSEVEASFLGNRVDYERIDIP